MCDGTRPKADSALDQAAAHGCAEARLTMTRRSLMGITAGLFSWAYAPRFAHGASGSDPRLLVVILRGGMDGLSTVVPYADPHYASMRGSIAIPQSRLLTLDSMFGLHPAMPIFGKMFADGEASVVHACSPPLHNRSHFDCQDNLENGLPGYATFTTGWLNRLLAALPEGDPIRSKGAIEIGEAPLILRGPAPVLGWSPTWLQHVNAETTDRIRGLYAARDPRMLEVLDRGLLADKLAEEGADGADDEVSTLRKGFIGAGRLLGAATGPRIAALSVHGWDTHSSQGGVTGELSDRLGELDVGLDDFRKAAGEAWRETVVLVVTEFGRTVRINGDGGTDHGVGTVTLLAGGAVAGGKVVADWPGLAASNLFEGSDLKPTTDMRAVFKGVLKEHLDVPDQLLDATVFPDSASVRPVAGLVASSRRRIASREGLRLDQPVRVPTGIARYRETFGVPA